MTIRPEESRATGEGEPSPLAGLMLSFTLAGALLLLGCRTEQKRAESRAPFPSWPWSTRTDIGGAPGETPSRDSLRREPAMTVPVPPPAPPARSWAPPAAPSPELTSPVNAEDFYGVRPTSAELLEATPILRPVPDSRTTGH